MIELKKNSLIKIDNPDLAQFYIYRKWNCFRFKKRRQCCVKNLVKFNHCSVLIEIISLWRMRHASLAALIKSLMPKRNWLLWYSPEQIWFICERSALFNSFLCHDARPDYFIISQLDLNFELLNPVIKFWYKTQINYVPAVDAAAFWEILSLLLKPSLQYGPRGAVPSSSRFWPQITKQEEDFLKYFKTN